ncbi:MAG: hypothetical protein K9J27_05075 [Bacteroidales bacterium]|nr:hypothetical protein [Bacteroidales bacterium]MCF8333078.1 hypothetical protein [Bacteroidales bacterium]
MIYQIIPSAEALPVNWWWFQVLLIVTFLLHLILMNFILGGSLLTLWDAYRKKTFKRESMTIPTLIALTINLGVPPLLFLQVLYGNFFYTSSVIMASPWILIIPILILAYYGAYIYVFKTKKSPVFAKTSLTVTAIFLLYIAFMLVNNNTLMLRPERWEMYFANQSGWQLNLGEPTLWPRYLHFITAAIAVASLGKAIFYHFKKNNSEEEKNHEKTRGLKIFGFATMIQVIIGLWFWLSLPESIGTMFTGGDLFATIWLMLGIAIALFLIYSSINGKFKTTTFLLVFLLLNMVINREMVRHAYLKDIGNPANLSVSPEYGSLAMFLVVFLIGLGVLYYMIKLIIKPKQA